MIRTQLTLADRWTNSLAGANTVLRDVILVVGASVLLALSAHVQIVSPLPLTMQTFVVVLIAATLGSRRGALAVMAYLAEGAAGLPVFARGTAGPAYFLGDTTGYLIGFVACVFVVGRLAEAGWDRRFLTAVLVFAIGHVLILACGFIWRSAYVGPATAAYDGFISTAPGMIVKTILAAMVLPLAWKLTGRRDRATVVSDGD